MTMSPEQGWEYVADSQWAGWWGGYGAEHLLDNEMNERAANGWRLHAVDVKTFLWFGFTVWPPAFPLWFVGWALRTKLLYIFERPFQRAGRS